MNVYYRFVLKGLKTNLFLPSVLPVALTGASFMSLLPPQSLFLQLKSAPPDSLTYRLALCVFLVNYSYGGLAGVAHLWQEFVLELRYRWENTCLVYGFVAQRSFTEASAFLAHLLLLIITFIQLEAKQDRRDGRKEENQMNRCCLLLSASMK